MNPIVKLIKNVITLLFEVLGIAVLVWSILLIGTTLRVLTNVNQEIETIANAFVQYNRIVNDKTILPNFEQLIKTNVLIVNETREIMGSGTTITIDGKIFILSAGHLDDPTDIFFVVEGNERRPIILVKVNHGIDLSLFKYVTESDYDNLVTAKIAKEDSKCGDSVWAIGNPAGLEDAITRGTLVRKTGIHDLIDAKIYHGSSGGGLFNTRGELIGVNVLLVGFGDYCLGSSVNLDTINNFLSGAIESEI